MNVPFAYLMCVAMLVRLPQLSSDEPSKGKPLLLLLVTQLLALSVFAPSFAVGLFGAGVCLIRGIGWKWEHQRGAQSLLVPRLLEFAAQTTAIAVVCAPASGLSFREDLGAISNRVGHYFVFAVWLKAISWPALLGWLLGALLSMAEANLIVRWMIERLAIRPASLMSTGAVGVIRGGEYARGRAIGSLERLIVFALVSKGEYGALGLVIAAKGLARFKDLQDREFAEYFLIGTMLSMVLAGAIGLLAQAAIPPG